MYDNLPFGDGQGGTNTSEDPYHFAMLDSDTESGTDHAQFRNYSPAQGRWMRPDPYAGSYDMGNPQSFNRYAYVLNNPLSYVDPYGLDSVTTETDGDCTYTYYNYSTNSISGDLGTINSYSTLISVVCREVSEGEGGQNYTSGAVGAPNNTGCFVKGVASGATGALIVAGATVVAGAVLAPEVVSGALLVGGAYGLFKTGQSIWNNYQSGNQSGLAYSVGSAVGGFLAGGATSFPVRFTITGETNLPTSFADFLGSGKGIDFTRPGQNPLQAIQAAFKQGPDLLGAGLTISGGAGYKKGGC